MQHRRLALLLSALLILSLVLSACGPRPQQGELAQNPTSDQLLVDLPAVYIDYDEQGQATISGAALSALGALLGQDLSSLDRTPEDMQRLADAGIQHMFVNLTPSGLGVFANGKPMLSLAWTPETLANLGTLLGSMPDPTMQQAAGSCAAALQHEPRASSCVSPVQRARLCPWCRMKKWTRRAIIADATRNAPAALQAVLPENLQGMAGLLGGLLAGLPPLTITFDANGVGTLTGLAPFIASQIPAGAIALPADTLAQLQDLGIQSLNIKNSADGLNITVNGNELPMLMWNQGEMQNLAGLGIESGALQVLGEPGRGHAGHAGDRRQRCADLAGGQAGCNDQPAVSKCD
jgi:hypothetical protein